ncbi:thioredoxin family protein [Paraburkholderia sediminicola]|uniref:thioredoxin family protein n=1 Tax=Paraburkholderia sediminicola TaxID=458836 RepID=UPI0038B767A1
MQQTYDTLVAASKQAPEVVIFTAPWCGPCKMLKPSLQALQADYGFHLTELDVTSFSEAELSTLGVRNVPNVRVLSGGMMKAQFAGAHTKAQVREWLLGFNVITDGLEFE